MLSILTSVLQRDLGSAIIEFGLIAGLIALTATSMPSAPMHLEAALLDQQALHLSTQHNIGPQLWELVTIGD